MHIYCVHVGNVHVFSHGIVRLRICHLLRGLSIFFQLYCQSVSTVEAVLLGALLGQIIQNSFITLNCTC